MSSSSQLQPVLDRIDADFNNSLERLFTLLRINVGPPTSDAITTLPAKLTENAGLAALTLENANTYRGRTMIGAGTLKLTAAGSVDDSMSLNTMVTVPSGADALRTSGRSLRTLRSIFSMLVSVRE